jgi:hypothetical protein
LNSNPAGGFQRDNTSSPFSGASGSCQPAFSSQRRPLEKMLENQAIRVPDHSTLGLADRDEIADSEVCRFSPTLPHDPSRNRATTRKQ